MFAWAILFFIFALVAGVFGFGGLSHDFATIAKFLAVVGLILAIVTFFLGRRSARN
jgi:uncharacterized membrane protein YtjA (UPF0391 family)